MKFQKNTSSSELESFSGLRYICSHCGTRFNEEACPYCASTDYKETEEYQLFIDPDFYSHPQYTDPKERKRFLVLFWTLFIGIWVFVLGILVFVFLFIYLWHQ